MGRYLVEMADWLRAAGLDVVEIAGWQYRAKSSGGFADGRPVAICWHHDGSRPNASIDAIVRYEATGAATAPICNLHVHTNGVVYVIAAGATNTEGRGGPYGPIPKDAANSWVVGMEITGGNGGAYPQTQIDACFAASLAITGGLGLPPDAVLTHWAWCQPSCPGRKIDPAPAWLVEGPWTPSASNTTGTWSLDDITTECARRATPTAPSPAPTPIPGDDQVLVFVEVSDAWARFIATAQLDPLIIWQCGYTFGERAKVHAANLPHVSVSKAQLSGASLVGRTPPPPDDGGSGLTTWDPADFYEWVN